jgi:MerR family transcriptional regulator, copper efflux regulator
VVTPSCTRTTANTLIAIEDRMNIGEAAAAAGLSAKMVRHYESVGLLAKAARTPSNYRVYGINEIHTLRFIRRARALGFSMNQIRELLGLWQNKSRSSLSVKKIAGRHIDDLRRRIAEMKAMADTLDYLSRHCHGDHRPECPILEDLSAPAGPASPASARSRRPGSR